MPRSETAPKEGDVRHRSPGEWCPGSEAYSGGKLPALTDRQRAVQHQVERSGSGRGPRGVLEETGETLSTIT